jgi:hypothetical protein
LVKNKYVPIGREPWCRKRNKNGLLVNTYGTVLQMVQMLRNMMRDMEPKMVCLPTYMVQLVGNLMWKKTIISLLSNRYLQFNCLVTRLEKNKWIAG